jgi:hypothetical protein
LGRAGLSNGYSGGGGGGGFSSSAGFNEDFLNQTFHFHNPFDIFEQFMSHFGMEDDFGKSILSSLQSNVFNLSLHLLLLLAYFLDKWTRHIFHSGEK